jgi:hypothetical protein
MTDPTESRSVTPSQAVALYRSILKHGEESWLKWIELGRWIKERTALAAVKANATRGTTYAHYLKKALGQFYETYQKLSGNGTATALARCLDNLDAVTAFRNRTPDEDSRPNHPQRVWEAYEKSLRSTIDFGGDDDESEEEDEDEDKPARRRVGRSHNTEKELLAEIEALKERLSAFEMSIYPDINAERIWRRIVEILGHNARAGELAVKTGTALVGLGGRIVEAELEWDAGGSRQA